MAHSWNIAQSGAPTAPTSPTAPVTGTVVAPTGPASPGGGTDVATTTPVTTPPVVTPPPVTEVVVATPALPLPKNLVWGRFSNATLVSSQLAMLAYADASTGRHVTVGELGEYALWRAGPSGRLDASLKGAATFALASAEAWLTQPGGSSSAQVKGATLSMDFDLSTFAATVA